MTITSISSILLPGLAAAHVTLGNRNFHPVNNGESSITAQLSRPPRSSPESEMKQSANVMYRFNTTLDKSNKKRQTELPTTFLDNTSIAMTCETEPKPGFCRPESKGLVPIPITPTVVSMTCETEPKPGFCPTQSSGLAPVPITETILSMTCETEPKPGFCPTQSSGLAPIPITETILSMTCETEPKPGFCRPGSSGLAPVPITPTVISMPFALNENNLPQKTGAARNQIVALRRYQSLTSATHS